MMIWRCSGRRAKYVVCVFTFVSTPPLCWRRVRSAFPRLCIQIVRILYLARQRLSEALRVDSFPLVAISKP